MKSTEQNPKHSREGGKFTDKFILDCTALHSGLKSLLLIIVYLLCIHRVREKELWADVDIFKKQAFFPASFVNWANTTQTIFSLQLAKEQAQKETLEAIKQLMHCLLLTLVNKVRVLVHTSYNCVQKVFCKPYTGTKDTQRPID